MSTYFVKLGNQAEKDKDFWRKNSPRDYKKMMQLISELEEHPTWGTGKPEPLKGVPDGWSRHINKKDVMKYYVYEETVYVYVASARGHYGDH